MGRQRHNVEIPEEGLAFGDFEIIAPMERLGGAKQYAVVVGRHVPSGTKCAIKVQTMSGKDGGMCVEEELYRAAEKFKPAYVPKVLGAGVLPTVDLRVLALQLLGPSVQDVLDDVVGRPFSPPSATYLAILMLRAIRQVHKSGFVHTDLRPRNFAFPLSPTESRLYLVGGSHAHRYMTASGAHIACSSGEEKSHLAMLPMAAVREAMGITLSRRDDIESFVYVCVFLFTGSFPWLPADKSLTDAARANVAVHNKRNMPAKELCGGAPPIIAQMFRAVRDMAFETEPDYEWFEGLLWDHLQELGFKSLNEVPCDWRKEQP